MGAAIVLLAAAAGAGLWYWQRPRTIDVCVVTDYSFRQQRPDWQTFLQSRFDAANRIFSRTGVHWNFRHAGQPDPTGRITNMEERRQKLVRSACEADLILGVTGQPRTRQSGDIPAFAHTGFIVDSPAESEARNTLIFAQALAILFGAPTDPKGAGSLMTQPPESDTLPDSVRKLIARLRWYDFAHGTAALDGPWGGRVYDALVAAYSGRAGNAEREAHRLLGMSLAADQIYPPAITHLKQVVKLDPSSAPAHTELATLYTQNFQPAAAVPEYRAAVLLTPDSAAEHAGLAVALANAGAAEDAIDEFYAALRLKPRFAIAQAGLAYVLSQQLGRVDEAIAAYSAALEMNPALPAAIEGLERTKAVKERAAAPAVQRRAKVAAAPGDAAARFDLALAEARAGNLESGIQEFRHCIELDRSNGRAHANLATLLYVRKNYADALQEAQAASQSGFDPPASLVEVLKRKSRE
jgi:tetratricopeptide (TPR) repeat protein